MTDSQLAAVVLWLVLGLWMVLNCWVNYNTWLIWLAWRLRTSAPARPALPAILPRVTVQLPVYNEENVVARLLESVARLDWPRDRIEIQLLDDSSDGTARIAASVIERLRADGLSVTHVRRGTRDGFKAGALRDGLAVATGELILILDADFVPRPQLLRELAPWLSDPRVAMVQGRWGRLTPPRSLVERSSLYWIDRHFDVEQFARSRSGQFFHFNGSGGLWRRAAIEDAGGWEADTLAEDLDLSFRAWQRGWRFVYDASAVVPSEVPSTVTQLRIQQGRWARGAFQVARKAIPRLGAATWRDRVLVSLQLTGYSFPILMVTIALAAGATAWARRYHPVLGFFAGDLPMVGFFTVLLAQALWQGWKGGARRGFLEIEAATFGLGLAPLVLVRGISGLRTYGGVFQRTPKSTAVHGQLPPLVWVEALLGSACLANAAWATLLGAPWMALLPLMAGVGLLTFAWRTVFPGVGALPAKVHAPGVAPALRLEDATPPGLS